MLKYVFLRSISWGFIFKKTQTFIYTHIKKINNMDCFSTNTKKPSKIKQKMAQQLIVLLSLFLMAPSKQQPRLAVALVLL